MKIKTVLSIIIFVCITAVLAVAINRHYKQNKFTSVLYSMDKQKAADSIPVWMRGFPQIKKIAGDMDTVIEYQYQHNCISNLHPFDRVDCDSLAQRRDSLNKQLQDEIHTLNLQNKSQTVINAAIAGIKNIRGDQSLQVELIDIRDNSYSNTGKNVDVYKDSKGMEYLVDAGTNNVVQFAPSSGSSAVFKQTPILSQSKLEQQAEDFLGKNIANFAQVKTDFIYSTMTKPGNANYAFRWESKTKPAGEDMAPFVQLVVSPAGDVISFNDTRSLY